MKSQIDKWVRIGVVLALCCSAQAGTRSAPDDRDDSAMIQQVFNRLLAASDTSTAAKRYSSWPPQVSVATPDAQNAIGMDAGVMNAAAAAPDCQPVVVLSEALLTQIVQHDPDRLSIILGHELSHLLLGHTSCVPKGEKTALLQVTRTREQEYEADANGEALALKAGFSVHEGLKGIQDLARIGDYSSFEALTYDHPSWSDRLQRLDSAQAKLWRNMGAFSDASSFLALEDYRTAEECLRGVLAEFPAAPEVKGNLGYSMLMRYLGGLDVTTLRQFDVGQPAVGAFYGSSPFLMGQARGGPDEKLWNAAVAMLNDALAADGRLVIAKGNLGVAYLFSPQGPQAAKAISYLEGALWDLKADKTYSGQSDLDQMLVQKAIVTNYAVALSAGGRREDAMRQLAPVLSMRQTGGPRATLQTLAGLYNVSMLLAESDAPETQKQAVQFLRVYLQNSSPRSPWWELARGRYTILCGKSGQQCAIPKGYEEFHRSWAVVIGVRNEKGEPLRLGQKMEDVAAQLGPGVATVGAGGANLRRVNYPKLSLDVFGDQSVVAISLHGRSAPPVILRAKTSGVEAEQLRSGMKLEDFEKLMGDTPYVFEPVFDSWKAYRYYPDVGIAAEQGADGTVNEILIVQIPQTQ